MLGLRAGRPALLRAAGEVDPDGDRGALPVSGVQAPATATPRRRGPAADRRAVARRSRALLRKELLVELRTLESVPAMSLFALTTFVVFHFALNRNSVEGDLAAGILWVTLLFAAILGVNRLFVADADQGGFDALPARARRPQRDAPRQGADAARLPRRARDRGRAGVRAAAARPAARAGAAGACWRRSRSATSASR